MTSLRSSFLWGWSGLWRVCLLAVALGATGCQPTITSISPNRGPTSGGTSITIIGVNFIDVLSVTIGGRSLLGLSVDSNIALTGKRAGTLSRGEPIDLEHLPRAVQSGTPSRPSGSTSSEIDEMARQRDQLISLLQQHRGNVSKVARGLSVSRMQVHRWLKRLDITPARFRR